MADSKFSYRTLLRDSVRLYGWTGTASRLAGGVWAFARDFFPSRRRLRFGDLDFDFEERMDTTWSNVGVRTRFREIFAGRSYQATDPGIFAEMMEHVDIDPHEFAFLDLGCGKGRALLLARKMGFRRMIGVELLPELLETARQNVERLPPAEQSKFELLAADARTYIFPNEPTFLYLFDPFPPAVLAEVAGQLARSVQEHPRPVFVGYQNPVSEDILKAQPGFERLSGTGQWSLYHVAAGYERW